MLSSQAFLGQGHSAFSSIHGESLFLRSRCPHMGAMVVYCTMTMEEQNKLAEKKKMAWEERNSHQWDVNRGDGCCEEILRFVECSGQSCDFQQNREYSSFRRKQRPTTFAIASQHLALYNSLIFLNSSSLTNQNFINHLFFIFGDYIYFFVVNIFWFFFPFLFQSLILFYISLVKFFYIVHSRSGWISWGCS